MVWVRAESAGPQLVVCWGGGVSERKPHPSDLSDGQWLLIEPVITAWKDRHRSVSGHQGAYAMREIVNAILYQSRTGCQWACLPHDRPPKSASYYYIEPGDVSLFGAPHRVADLTRRRPLLPQQDPQLLDALHRCEPPACRLRCPASFGCRTTARRPGRSDGRAWNTNHWALFSRSYGEVTSSSL
jgi:hypothetical protein